MGMGTSGGIACFVDHCEYIARYVDIHLRDMADLFVFLGRRRGDGLNWFFWLVGG